MTNLVTNMANNNEKPPLPIKPDFLKKPCLPQSKSNASGLNKPPIASKPERLRKASLAKVQDRIKFFNNGADSESKPNPEFATFTSCPSPASSSGVSSNHDEETDTSLTLEKNGLNKTHPSIVALSVQNQASSADEDDVDSPSQQSNSCFLNQSKSTEFGLCKSNNNLSRSTLLSMSDKHKSLSSNDVHRVRKLSRPFSSSRESTDSTTSSPRISNLLYSTIGRIRKKSVTTAGDRMTNSSSSEARSSGSISQDSSESSRVPSQEVDAYPDIDQLGKSKAFHAAKEIYTTENSFNQALKLLNEDFCKFIEEKNQAENIVPMEEFNKIFSHIPSLQHLSNELLDLLLKRFQEINQWDDETSGISDIFIKVGPFLKHFSTYSEHYTENNELFDKLRDKHPAFKKAVAEFEAILAKQSKPKPGISSHLMVPFQRLTRYKILFDAYVKHLDPEKSQDYANAKKALEIVSEAAAHVNKLMAQNENFRKVLSLQMRLGVNDLIKADRYFIKEGPVDKVCRNKEDQRYLILFSDELIVATPYNATNTDESLHAKYRLPIASLNVQIPDNTQEFPQDFYVISQKKSFTFRSKSVEDKDEWVKVLKQTMEDSIQRSKTFAIAGNQQRLLETQGCRDKLGYSAPLWIPDDHVSMCQSCYEDFTLMFRKHHCRGCGLILCYACSDQRAPLRYKNYEVDRVCDKCFDVLYQEFGNYEAYRSRFRKRDGNKTVNRKKVPKRLLVAQNITADAKMEGYLHKHSKTSGWKKLWVILSESVLYEVKAVKDPVAVETTPILGYVLEPEYQLIPEEALSKLPGKGQAFRLTHSNCKTLLYYAENDSTAQKWTEALDQAIQSI